MNNYAFIDIQNVHLAIRSLGWKIDWSKFRVYLSEKYKITKAYVFIGYIPDNNSLYIKLQSAGFICVFKPVVQNKDGSFKGNTDAELVLQAMIDKNKYDSALIATGDGDFYCLIRYLKMQNKLRTVLVPNQNQYSVLLRKTAQKDISFMNNLKHLIMES